MKKAAMAARLLLGLIYFVFGLNGFLQFIPMPPMEGAPGAFMGALFATGYFFPVLKATEVICGALLLANMAPLLALVVLAPITLQIFLFHFFMTPGQAGMAIFMLLVHGFLGYTNWNHYRFLFTKK